MSTTMRSQVIRIRSSGIDNTLICSINCDHHVHINVGIKQKIKQTLIQLQQQWKQKNTQLLTLSVQISGLSKVLK